MTIKLEFIKMHGLGNDFVIFDQRMGGESLTLNHILYVANRHRGIGCDQVIHIKPPKTEGTAAYLDMYNADGQGVGACGNATRCVADIIMRDEKVDNLRLETQAGILDASRADENMVTIDMGKPGLEWREIPTSEPCETLSVSLAVPSLGGHDLPTASLVNMGNPHAVFFVEDVEDIDLEHLGPKIETHKFFPEKTNVEFAQILGKNKIRKRVWERGTGVTQACGSGACAALVAAVRRGLSDRKAELILDGGSLFIEWRESDNKVLMTGPVAYVFDGVIEIE